jgi:hypothetical protein
VTNISRRYFARLGVLLPFSVLASAVAQEAPKPEIKISEAKPIIREYVEKMAADARKNSGVEFTAEQKAQLVDSIIANMKGQHIYAFVDP